jgi:acetyl-CoA synthetase
MNWIWQPTPEWTERTNVWRMMQRLGFSSRENFLAWSRDKNEEFWSEMTRETNIHWFQPYAKVLDTSRGVEWAQWFVGGKINIVDNCLDRHVHRTNPAILWETESGDAGRVTFADLADQVNRIAAALQSLGLEQGDRVALVMPMIPEVVAILYACLKLGLVVVPIFAGFGPGAIRTRVEDSGAKLIVTAAHLQRRGKLLPLRPKVEEARGTAMVRDYHELLAAPAMELPTAQLDSEATALIIYTSGTTGKPKGTVHTHAGCLAQMSKEIWLGFDHKDDDRFFWLSDIGWMMGPWTIIGNHHFGGTIFLYDGAPDYPSPDRLWQILDRCGITTFGVSPTAIRVLMRSSDPAPFSFDRLRLLGSTGEPWDESSYSWFFENIGKTRAPIINISGGTEIVGCFLFPLPIQALKPCTLGDAAPGMAATILNDAGEPVPRGSMGYLACTKPAPSMTRGVWGDPKRYLDTYWSKWPGVWHHGDWATVDEDGCWFLHGRADESMNVAGRKVGPAEVEDALIEHPAVSEAAVIGVPDDVKGEGIVGFVVLKPGNEADSVLMGEVEKTLLGSLGPTFRPNALHAVKELPKTQSGKIVRRLIRQKYLGEPLGDTSTVQNPAALEQFDNQKEPRTK